MTVNIPTTHTHACVGCGQCQRGCLTKPVDTGCALACAGPQQPLLTCACIRCCVVDQATCWNAWRHGSARTLSCVTGHALSPGVYSGRMVTTFCANKAGLEVGLLQVLLSPTVVHCTLTPCPSRYFHAMHCMQCARGSHRCSLWSSLGVLLRVSLPSHGPCASLFSGARPPLSPTELCSCVR